MNKKTVKDIDLKNKRVLHARGLQRADGRRQSDRRQTHPRRVADDSIRAGSKRVVDSDESFGATQIRFRFPVQPARGFAEVLSTLLARPVKWRPIAWDPKWKQWPKT
jgi:hypothetical protein